MEYAHEWLFGKISSALSDEIVKICIVLWGVWFWRNKRVWDDKTVTPAFAMDSSFKMYAEWLEAKKIQVSPPSRSNAEMQSTESKWCCPDTGILKVNVDVSVFPNASTFTVGMVMRNHRGSFVAGKSISLPMADSVFEAETIGISEALSWIKVHQVHGTEVVLESDSLLAVKAITVRKLIYWK